MCVCVLAAAIGLPKCTDLFCATHVCVCVCVCVLTEARGWPALHFFCATHVCARSSSCRELTYSEHTCVCPQQQSVGQPLTLGCSPRSTYSATHIVCVCVCAHSSNWSANVVECSKPSNDFFIGFSLASSATRMLCAHSSNWSAKVVECSKPSNDFFIDLFCKTHVCVLTAPIGRPTLGQGQKPP